MSAPNLAVVAYLMSLERFEDAEVLALSNATAFGNRLPQLNLAYKKSKDLGLIDDDGCFHDLIRDALAIEVERRFS